MRRCQSNNLMTPISKRIKRSPVLTLLMVAVTLLASAGYAWSQLRARVELVVVPVNVRDGDGRLVPGLTQEEFSIFEDGKPQTISSFSIDPIPLSAAIVLDDGMSGNALKRIVPLLSVMTAGFAPEDEMASFRYDHVVWKLSDFTSDPAVIQKSFNEIARIAETRPAEAEPNVGLARGPRILQSLAGIIGVGSNGAPSTVPSGKDRPKPVPTSRLLHDAVYQAATSLRIRPADRRRIIFLISNGQASGANAQNLDKNVDFLLQNDIQVYAVALDFGLIEGAVGNLGVYARSTGGDVFSGSSTRDVETAFARITEQARNQYILGYYSTNSPGGIRGTYRSINVKTSRPGVSITHRKGYVQYPAK